MRVFLILKWVLLVLLSTSPFTVKSQISDLVEFAQGELLLFSPITEIDDDIYGYFLLYDLGKISEEREKYEYVLLDTNLNKVSNGEFEDRVYRKLGSAFISPVKSGNKLIITKHNYATFNIKKSFTTNWVLSIDSNSMSDAFYLEEGDIVNGYREEKGWLKKEKKKETIDILVPSGSGFMTYPIRKLYKEDSEPDIISHYTDLNNEKEWEHVINPYSNKLNRSLDFIDEKTFLLLYKDPEDYSRTLYLRNVDMENGQERFATNLTGANDSFSRTIETHVDAEGNTIITGELSKSSVTGFNYKTSQGYYKKVLDSLGNTIVDKHLYWADTFKFDGKLDVDEKGNLDDGYRLYAKEYFFLKDGSIYILTEKLKVGYNFFLGSNVKTTDLVLLHFDKNFELVDSFTIKKDISKWFLSDYLYAQYVNDNSGVVFFYRDYKEDIKTKEKNWELGIVSLIDAKLKVETIPMSSEEFFIRPYIAKEGHILLREYNKDDDYDQIRLEKINY